MITITIILCLLTILLLTYSRETYVASTIDNKEYAVLSNFSDQTDAANRLARINHTNLALIDYMVKKYNTEGTLGYTLATRLKKRYRPDRLVENNPPGPDDTSYTENKGEKVALCLREKKSGGNVLHDQSLIEFVDLHEMAHIASEGIGHEDEFWKNFEFILIEAFHAGLHKPQDYSKDPVNYCGLDVSYNPFYNGT